MKREQTVWMFIVVLVILLAAMPYMIITIRAFRLTAELAFDNKSVASGTVDMNIEQNQSGINEQINVSTEAPNVIHAKVCVEQ